MESVDPKMLNGKVLAWQFIGRVSPFINSLAAFFLIGGAIHSAIRFFRHRGSHHVSIGNTFIAIGAILPGIGGMGSRLGQSEIFCALSLVFALLNG